MPGPLGLLIFFFTGLIVATIAKALMPGRDPGLGMTVLLGTAAQMVGWLFLRAGGLEQRGQPWQFFLSIAAAAMLLHLYRESGLDERLTRQRIEAAAAAEVAAEKQRAAAPPRAIESIWVRLAYAPGWAAAGAVMLGLTGFLIGFFGPMHFAPGANQGPMLGLFITGPGGVLLGAFVGAALRIAQPGWPMRWRMWVLNVANAAYGLLVFKMVVDPRWR
jgi:uncharacterized membrane protein YeaQ/YmgE (transglycosylase-associated protein family)